MAKTNRKSATVAELRAAYSLQEPMADRLVTCLKDQISALLEKNSITLGVPMESRVKRWPSIEEKLQRKSISIKNITDLRDLVGLRMILLFKRDLISLDRVIRDNFHIISVEDTAHRLQASQFGYQSQHYIVKLLPSWLSLPSYADLGDTIAEIQVRTISQHIWAAASHKLQYKREESVPIPLRRTIYRVSALLETVDLEFDRVLSERRDYIDSGIEYSEPNAQLNVELIASVAKELLPESNSDGNKEDFDELLVHLNQFNVNTISQLRDLIKSQMNKVMKAEAEALNLYGNEDWADEDRTARGVYYTHAGLIREALIQKFGDKIVREKLWGIKSSDD